MKPLVFHIVVLSAIILSIQAEHKEANVKSADYGNFNFDNSHNDLEDHRDHAYQIRSSFEDIGDANSNEGLESDEESQPESEVKAFFPYQLYSKVKVTLPASTKFEKHVLMPVLVDKPVPVKILVDQPFLVEKRVPVYYPVKINKPYPVNKYIRVPVKVNVPVKKLYPVYKDVPVEVPVYVEKLVPKFVDRPYPVPVYRKKKNGAEENVAEKSSKDVESLKHHLKGGIQQENY